MILYKHINNTDVAVQLINRYRPPSKSYSKIQIVWWSISGPKQYCTNFKQRLKYKGSEKFPDEVWNSEWKPYPVHTFTRNSIITTFIDS